MTQLTVKNDDGRGNELPEPLLRNVNGSLGLGQGCCCAANVPCNVSGAQSGGSGFNSKTIEGWPSEEKQFYFCYEAFSIPDRFVVKSGGRTLLNTGSVSGGDCRCLTKPTGATTVIVEVTGPEGTAWSWGLYCECPPPPPPGPCQGSCNNGSCGSKQQPCYCCSGGCQTTRCSCCLADLTGRSIAFEGKTFTWGTSNTIIESNAIWEANFPYYGTGEFSRIDFLTEVPDCIPPLTVPTRGVYLTLSCQNQKWVSDVFTYCAPRAVSSPCNVQQTAYQARAYFAEVSCIDDGANDRKPYGCLGNLQDQEGFPYNNDEFPGRCEAPYADFCIY